MGKGFGRWGSWFIRREVGESQRERRRGEMMERKVSSVSDERKEGERDERKVGGLR